MNPVSYFQANNDYFWQWEDNMEIIAIPSGSTIAYQKYIRQVLQALAPQGLPPFGSLLLAIIATNPENKADIRMVEKYLSSSLDSYSKSLPEAITFMRTLAQLPEKYKTGKDRIYVFQTIFQDCHYIYSLDDSAKIVNAPVVKARQDEQKDALGVSMNPSFHRDFRTFALLNRKYPSVRDILKAVASIPEVEEEIWLPQKTKEPEEEVDLLEQLVDNPKTFHIGALIQRIWSGIYLPKSRFAPSKQSLGGIADISNKGSFDKLLISEFANDDIVFLQRLANNEALYIQREAPPSDKDLQRIILIDVSIKSWGTPKVLSFATMLAIAKHPKSAYSCTAYAIGQRVHQLEINSLDGIIEGMEHLDTHLHFAEGMESFFKEIKPGPKSEIILISEGSSLKRPEVQQAMDAYRAHIHYFIQLDRTGQIDVFRNQRSGRKHIQGIVLPLKQLWTKRKQKKKGIPKKLSDNLADTYPILFRQTLNRKQVLICGDDFYVVNKEGALLRCIQKDEIQKKKGWKLLFQGIPKYGSVDIGLNDSGEFILFYYNPKDNQIMLQNLHTRQATYHYFRHWNNHHVSNLIFHNGKFIHLHSNTSWVISLDGKIEEIPHIGEKVMKAIADKAERIEKFHKIYLFGESILKNVHTVFINIENELVFNVHRLYVNKGGHMKLEPTKTRKHLVRAQQLSTTEFAFEDDSRILINRSGMFTLVSSNPNIPRIYVPSVIDAWLGAAAGDHFSGNPYYHHEEEVALEMLASSRFYEKYIGQFINQILTYHGA